MEENKPSCSNGEDSKTEEKGTCREQELWLGFYRDFAQRRKVGLKVPYVGLS